MATGVDDQLVLAASQRVGRALQHLGTERLDVGHEDPDHVGALRSQAASDEAGLVPEIGDDDLDPVEGGGRDAVPTVDDTRDGGDRNAGALGDVADRDAIEHARRMRLTRRRASLDSPPKVVASTPECSAIVVENVYRVITRPDERKRRVAATRTWRCIQSPTSCRRPQRWRRPDPPAA